MAFVVPGRRGSDPQTLTLRQQKDSTITNATAVVNNDESFWPPVEQLDPLVDEHRRLIVLSASCDYADFADNLMNSLLTAGVTNFVVVPLDATVHSLLATRLSGACDAHLARCGRQQERLWLLWNGLLGLGGTRGPIRRRFLSGYDRPAARDAAPLC